MTSEFSFLVSDSSATNPFEGGLIKADAVGIGSWLPLENMSIAQTEGSLIYIEAFEHIRFIPEVDPIEALEIGQAIFIELTANSEGDRRLGLESLNP